MGQFSTVDNIFIRYADDFLIALCQTAKAEAEQMKTEITTWMRTNLGLNLNQEKTHITHGRERLRFLGYELQACVNRNGTRWLRLSEPREAVSKVVAKVEQATTYPQAPEYDVFRNINAMVWGWTN